MTEPRPHRGLQPEAKARIGKQIDRTAQKWEPQFGEQAAQQFEIDKRNLLAILNKAKSKAYRSKATVDWQTVDRGWQSYLDEAGERWRGAFVPLIQGEITDQAEHLNATFGMQFDVRNLFAEKWFDEYTLEFAQPIMDTTKKDISALLKQGMEEGWSVTTMRDHLEDIFEQWMSGDLSPEDFEWFEQRMPDYRRENISRTETMRASNAGSHNLYKSWDPGLYKEWLATADNRTRDDHLDAWQRYREGGAPGPIPLDEPFIVGGEPMMYPGDPSASAKQVCFCRCTELPWSPAWGEEGAGAEVPAAEGARQQLLDLDTQLDQERITMQREKYRLLEQIARVRSEYNSMAEQGFDIELLAAKRQEWQEMSEQYSELAEKMSEFSKMRSEELRRQLYVDNPSQVTSNYLSRVSGERRQVWDTGFEAFKKMVGTGTMDKEWVDFKAGGKGRSYQSAGTVYMTTSAGERAVVHELGHALEYRDPEVHRKALEFLEGRTAGENAEWLGDDYDRRETTRRDKFISAYMGKDYGGRATEIVSMGMEYMYAKPARLAKEDPGYFDFMYNLLRGN